MSTIDRDKLGELLSAYIDGEVSDKQKELIERSLREDEGARRLLDELRMTVDAVSSLPRHAAPESIAEDVQSHVERSELLGEPGGAAAGRAGRRVLVPAVVSAAAVVGLSVGGLWIMLGRDLPGDRGVWDSVAHRTEVRDEVATEKGGRGAERLAASSEAELAEGYEEENRLVEMASFDQKLQAGMGLTSVQRHAFRNEPVRLQVSVRDEAERDAVTGELVAYLSERDVIDLDGLPADEPEQAGSFYYQGRPVANFTETGQKQLLVRASRHDLEEALDLLADATGTDDSVALSAGPLSIRGREQVRTVLYSLDSSAAGARGRPAAPPDTFGDRPAAEKVARDETAVDARGVGGGLLADVREIVGYDTEALTEELVRTAKEEKQKAVTSRPAGAGPDAVVSREPAPVAAPSTGRLGPGYEGESDAGEEAAKGDSLASMRQKEGPVALPEEPSSLVDRRWRAAEEARRRADQDSHTSQDLTAPAAYRALLADHAAQYITLVVEVSVGKPPARRPKSAVKTDELRSEDTTAE